jgi:hypothetical protein
MSKRPGGLPLAVRLVVARVTRVACVALAIITGSSLANTSTARAQVGVGGLQLFRRLECDPKKEYTLTDNQGPWLILCSTFLGDEGELQAKELVIELRRDFKVPAYTHRMEWDFDDKLVGRGLDKYGRPKQMKHANYKQRQETAVLVGDFPTIDDPEGQRLLDVLRYAKTKCLDPDELKKNNKKTSQALGAWRWVASRLSNDEEMKRRGPMGKAFMCANPLIPAEYFNPSGLDPLVVKMNEPVEHSLLKCPGKYSVKVATFGGATISIPKEVEAIEKGEKHMKSRLELAAISAHNLTIALRSKGYEAYEFHDHGASFVTVGNFEYVGTPRADGKYEINPEIHELYGRFGAGVTYSGGRSITNPAKYLAGIPFDVQPVAIEVPRTTISSAYQRSNLTLR